jgi:CubicO group peptidase (beta-lactamase class C family)
MRRIVQIYGRRGRGPSRIPVAALLPGAASVSTRVLAVALLLGTAPASGHGQDPIRGCPAALAPVADTVRAVMRAQNLPSVALAVAQHGEVVCEAAFGFADVANRRAATPGTVYSLASISKPFTATAVMQLVERGQVELDAPANRYLGLAQLRAFEGDADSATIRRLLTHTAGLPLHYQFFYAGGPRAPSMDESIARHGILVYPPGERYVYANFGFGVLDEIIARVSGVSYAEYLRSELFEPLGLEHTLVGDGAGLGPDAAVRYGADGSVLPPYTFDHVGASGLWSSAADLVRFGMFHLGQQSPAFAHVLGDDARERMQSSDAAADAPGLARGLGWGIAEDDNGYRRISHTGSMPGVATALNLYPEEGLVIVVLTNLSHSPSVARIAGSIAGVMLPGYSARAAQPQQATVPPAQAAAPQAAAAAVPAGLHGAWYGAALLYEGRVPVMLQISEHGVSVRVDDGDPLPLEAARFAAGWLTGRVDARLAAGEATPEAARDRHSIIVNVTLRDGERLAGWVSSISTGQPLYGAVSFRVELRRR